MELPMEKLAKAFDSLKKPQRIKAMFLAAETDLMPAEIADELDMSESGVRNYLNDLIEAGILQNGDHYSYTEYGDKISSEVEIMLYEEEEQWLSKKREQSERLRDRMKLRQKRNIKDRIRSVIG
jgi:predicted transcriptional regulator